MSHLTSLRLVYSLSASDNNNQDSMKDVGVDGGTTVSN